MSGRGGNGRGAAVQRPLVSKPARSTPQSSGQPSLAACAGALLSPRATHRYVNGDEQEENLLDQALYDGEEEDEEGMGIGAGSASKMQPLEHPAPLPPSCWRRAPIFQWALRSCKCVQSVTVRTRAS